MIILSVESSVTEIPSTPAPKTNSTVSKTEDHELDLNLQNSSPCVGEYSGFCINGHCTFHKGLRNPICRCPSDYIGERCGQLSLPSNKPNDNVTYVAIGIGLGLLISGFIAFIWCYRNKRCKKAKANYGICSPDGTL
ncbi:epigen [Pelodytes ibericus]